MLLKIPHISSKYKLEYSGNPARESFLFAVNKNGSNKQSVSTPTASDRYATRVATYGAQGMLNNTFCTTVTVEWGYLEIMAKEVAGATLLVFIFLS